MRLHIIDSTVSALTTQKTFLNNFKSIVNCKVDIWEDIKHYQDTLSYALNKANYSLGEGVPSNMNLNIKARATGYNNEILVSNSRFSLGRNDMVNAWAPEKSSHKTSIVLKNALIPNAAHKEVLSKHTSANKAELTHKEEKHFNTHSG